MKKRSEAYRHECRSRLRGGSISNVNFTPSCSSRIALRVPANGDALGELLVLHEGRGVEPLLDRVRAPVWILARDQIPAVDAAAIVSGGRGRAGTRSTGSGCW